MEGFDIVTLRLFLAIARLGSIASAARSEHIAISAASRRISDLEYNLDTILITRTPAGASLTAAGKAFSRHCELLLRQYASIRADLKRFAHGETGELRLASIPRALDGTLPFTIAEFKRDNPAIRVTVRESYTRQGLRFLREDIADLAIIYDSVDVDGFEVVPFKKDPLWLVGKKDHPLFSVFKNRDSISFEETLNYEHISYHEGGVLDELISDAKREIGRTSKSDIKVFRVNSLFRCVEAGLGLGIIGERDLQPHLNNPSLKAIRLDDEWASRNLVCVYHTGQAASPTVQRFLEYILKKIP